MRTIVIGDTHFHNTNRSLRTSQIRSILSLCKKKDIDQVVFLGDLFDKRNPSSECVLDVRYLVNSINKPIHIIRGNHDTSDKSDNPRTILSVLENTNIYVYDNTSTYVNKDGTVFYFIPHYENEEIIRKV